MKKLKDIGVKTVLIRAVIIFIVAIFIAGFIHMIILDKIGASSDNTLYLNNLNYDVTVLENGDAKVIETWDINIKNTNTLFKTFKLRPFKYSGITDVEVGMITNNGYVPLRQIYEEMYHVTTDCYYGLDLGHNEFEIAWGTGLENSSARRKYQVSYVINDLVTDYYDSQEIYWQFLGEGENEIPANKVTGTITLPQDVANIDDIRVWGHGQLNGEINKVNNHQVEFKLDGLGTGSRLEVRIVTEDKIFYVANINKIRNYNGLPSILSEEQKWADEANLTREIARYIIIGLIIIYIIIMVIYLIKILNVRRYQSDEQNKKFNIQYFRDIPREKTATPAEAAYLYKFNKTRLYAKDVQQDAVSATILDLCLKKQITLRTDEKSNVFIQVIGNGEDLKPDELEIYKLLKKVGQDKEFEVENLKKYAHDKYDDYRNKIINLVNSTRNSLYKLALIDKKNEKKHEKYQNADMKSTCLFYAYLVAIAVLIIINLPFYSKTFDLAFGTGARFGFFKTLIILLPFIIELLYYYKLQKYAKNKIAVLTEEGAKEKAEWKGLVNYMQDFSNFKEKTVPDLILWEKYLVFATALGIGDTVVKQMKAAYPEVFAEEYWENENISNNYPIINFAMNPIYIHHSNFNPIGRIGGGIESAYKTSITEFSKHTSSGGGRTVASQAEDGRTVEDGRTEWEADKKPKKGMNLNMERTKVIAGNWKMNMLPNEAIDFIQNLEPLVKNTKNEVVLCVPFIDLFYSILTAQDTNIKIGAQNVHFEEKGAYTGEVSAKMLSSIGVEYVIIGHSERRQYFAETDETVNKKIKAALANNLKPIVCVR